MAEAFQENWGSRDYTNAGPANATWDVAAGPGAA
jgi:hypothetical protein